MEKKEEMRRLMCTLLTWMNPVKRENLLSIGSRPGEFWETGPENWKKLAGLNDKDCVRLENMRRDEKAISDMLEEMDKKNIRLVTRLDSAYPKRLEQLEEKPFGLFYLGSLPEEGAPTVAIVGARACSPYGRNCAERFGRMLARVGVQVISGLASGIDSEGHKGALEGSTPTFAVLGSGADICYPTANRNLYERILREGGGIITEYEPGTPPMAFRFPARNRIISALSDVVLIVEAREKSGSLITADCALEQGKAIYAVPGAVTDSLSRGCNKLIFDGAGIAYCPEVLLGEWGMESNEKNEQIMNEKKMLTLASDLKLLYSYLDSRPVAFDTLVRKSGLDARKVSSGLVELTLMGFVREVGKHYYIRQ